MIRPHVRRTTRISIGLESLEGRRVFATAGSSSMVATLKGALTSGISYLDLQGTAHGSTSTITGNPDVGTTVDFQGSGNVSGLGSVKMTGSLSGTGFFAKSHVQWTITLSNHRGTFSLQLQSPATGGFQAPESGTYSFKSLKATGAFRKDFGNGTIELRLHGNSFTMTFLGKPNVS
jgi:hypothetical protein